MPVGAAATYQQLAFAVTLELLIVGALVAVELMGGDLPRQAAVSRPVVHKRDKPRAPATPAAQPQRKASPAAHVVAEGDIAAFVHDRLHPAEDKRVALDDVYANYVTWCASNKSAVERAAFNDWFDTTGRAVGLDIRKRGRKVVCEGVELGG